MRRFSANSRVDLMQWERRYRGVRRRSGEAPVRRPRGLRLATYVALTVYACVVVAAPHLLPSWARDVLVGNLPFVGAAALLVRRAASEPEQRSWTLPLALATTVYLLGNIAALGSACSLKTRGCEGVIGKLPIAALTIQSRRRGNTPANRPERQRLRASPSASGRPSKAAPACAPRDHDGGGAWALGPKLPASSGSRRPARARSSRCAPRLCGWILSSD